MKKKPLEKPKNKVKEKKKKKPLEKPENKVKKKMENRITILSKGLKECSFLALPIQ